MLGRLLPLLVLGAVATPAAAQPAAPAPCAVEMVRVPDAVRPVIAEWVAAEPRCAVQLSVRVIPTSDGLYVLASDPSGRIRERVVPDATTAAVLIASWVADDGVITPVAAPAPAAPAPDPEGVPGAVTPTWAMKSPPVTPTWAMKNPPVTPTWALPSAIAAPGSVLPMDVGAVASSPRRFRRLASVGLTVHEHGAGVRGDLDIWKKWRMKLGVMAAWSHTQDEDRFGRLTLDDVILAAQAANDLRWRRFELRGSVALGFAITSGTPMDGTASGQSALSPVGDAVITGGVALTSQLQLRAGVALTLLPQSIYNGEWWADRDFIPAIFVGLGYREE